MTENHKPKQVGIERFFKSSAASSTTQSQTASSSSEGSNANTSKRDENEVSSLPKETFEEETNAFSNKPHQPSRSFPFPKQQFGKQQRSCQPQWFEEYPWLDYDENRDCVTCFTCKSQISNLKSERNKEETFLTTGYRNWKKARYAFSEHQKSKCHLTAMTFEVTVPKCGDVREMMSREEASRMELNRQCLMKIIETLQFIGRQGLALRGDSDDEDSNFIQLLKLRGKDVPDLIEWIKRKKNKFTSHDIQNEILVIMSNQITRKLSESLQNNFYSIICDEYTDISNTEQLSFCLRWVDNCLCAHEDFIGFYALPDIKSDTIVAVIKDVLLRLQLSLQSCRGQCYDGASNMLGRKSGVATQIYLMQPKAHYTHCHCHSLSLSVKDTTGDCKALADAMGVAGEIAVLIKFSPKRERLLEELKDQMVREDEEENPTPSGLTKLSTTRWTVRATSFQRIIDNYAVLMKVWNDCLTNEKLTTDIKSRIIGCQSQMQRFSLFFGLNLGQRLYAHTDNLSKTLQHQEMSATSGKRLANLTVQALEGMRNGQAFNMFYDTILKKAKEFPFVSEPSLPRKRRAPNYSVLQYVEGYNAEGGEYHPDSPRDHFRQIYLQAIDVLVTSIKDRFNQPSFLAYERLESFLLKGLRDEDISGEFSYLQQMYSSDVNVEQLKVEMDVLKVIMKGENPECFDDILKHLKSLKSEERELIVNIVQLCKILIVNPSTSATAERTFSLARRVKTWMRSTMTASRFNALAVLKFHKEKTDNLDLVSVANTFVCNENRRSLFGHFK